MPYYWGSLFGVFGVLFAILWWVLTLALIVALLRLLIGRKEPFTLYRTPLGILKERYVRGEITKLEFEEKKKDLEE